jgi:hypothetical protein
MNARSWLAAPGAVVLLGLALAAGGCGRYGPPRRIVATPPAAPAATQAAPAPAQAAPAQPEGAPKGTAEGPTDGGQKSDDGKRSDESHGAPAPAEPAP